MEKHNSCKPQPKVMKNSKPSNRKVTPNRKINDERSDSKEQICDICAQNVPGPEREKIFAFGECDHYVCYVCSARLRVICDQSECPICRKKLDNVLFSSNRNVPYEKTNSKDWLYNDKYKIYFESKAAQSAFDKLLKYECEECLKRSMQAAANKKTSNNKSVKDDQQKSSSVKESCSSGKDKSQKSGTCKEASTNNQSRTDSPTQLSSGAPKDAKKLAKVESSGSSDWVDEDSQGLLTPSMIKKASFQDVFGLRNHLNHVHQLKLCDLCLTHNNLFPFEYSYYTSAALRKHMKEGEPKTSHRGHPSCVLCQNTFFNTDELIQHMSREHFHCHLCGRHDSNMRIYFLDYNSLRVHFKDKHFLCERDHCRHEQFTSAFDNRIDYQCHLVQVHGNPGSNLSRGESRQQRTITLDSASHRASGASPTIDLRHNLPPNAALVSTGNVATANRSRQQLPESIQVQIRQQRLPSRSEFPALGHNSTASVVSQVSLQNPSFGNNSPGFTQANPSHQNASSVAQRYTAGPSHSRDSFVRTLGGGYRPAEQLDEMDFPPLPEQPKVKGSKKPKPQAKSLHSRKDNNDGPLTLEQLISNSLTLNNRSSKFNGKKSGSKGSSGKSSKNMKQKPIKIQIS